MSVTAIPAPKVWTEAEIEALTEDGYNHEIVDGELVMSPKNNFFHGDICMRLSTALNNFVTERRLGVVLDSSTGFWMQNRNCRAPAISFVTRTRLVTLGFKRRTRSFFPGAPDIPSAVEAGIGGMEAKLWFGLFAPAKTPASVVAKLNGALSEILRAPETQDTFLKQGVAATPSTPQELRDWVTSEVARWTPVIQNAGIRAD